MRIPATFLRQLLVRGVVIWVFARVAAYLISEFARGMAGDAGLPFELATHPVSTILVAASLVLADLHRRKELMLLNNLGVVIGTAVLIGTIPALLFEGLRATLVA